MAEAVLKHFLYLLKFKKKIWWGPGNRGKNDENGVIFRKCTVFNLKVNF